MQTLPNGVTIFNATPHLLTFWSEEWDEPVEVAPDKIINARPVERPVSDGGRVQLVSTQFVGDDNGHSVMTMHCPSVLTSSWAVSSLPRRIPVT